MQILLHTKNIPYKVFDVVRLLLHEIHNILYIYIYITIFFYEKNKKHIKVQRKKYYNRPHINVFSGLFQSNRIQCYILTKYSKLLKSKGVVSCVYTRFFWTFKKEKFLEYPKIILGSTLEFIILEYLFGIYQRKCL